MSSQSCPFTPNPRANVFLLVNLGCEMLYVIDQRLNQCKTKKSMQVIHEITAVLLEPKFIDSLIIGSTQPNAQLLTADQCRFMLNDIAVCSVMRLDNKSMDKLWNLMTVVYKWQLYVSRHQHHLLDITFRHLDGIAQMYGDASEKHRLLVDFTKNTLLDFWNAANDEEQLGIYRTSKSWLECFNTKISLLIRLGLQDLDGAFVAYNESEIPPHFEDFVQTIGVNVYAKASLLANVMSREPLSRSGQSSQVLNSVVPARRVDQLTELLSTDRLVDTDDLQPIDVNNVQRQFEASMQQCNDIFANWDSTAGGGISGNDRNHLRCVGIDEDNHACTSVMGEFVQVQTIHTRQTMHTTNATEEVPSLNSDRI